MNLLPRDESNDEPNCVAMSSDLAYWRGHIYTQAFNCFHRRLISPFIEQISKIRYKSFTMNDNSVIGNAVVVMFLLLTTR